MLLRKQGRSIGWIEAELSIPRSTLSGWFRNIILTAKQREALDTNWKEALILARLKASEWHRTAKQQRVAVIQEEVSRMLLDISPANRNTLEIALSFLYLGEGVKTTRTAMGNSDPRILNFFIYCIRTIYGVPVEKIRCALHLRADQNPNELTKYWSKVLSIPITNFTKPSIDVRTAGRPTYNSYKGVCLVECGRVDIQRRLMYIANGFCEKTKQKHMRA